VDLVEYTDYRCVLHQHVIFMYNLLRYAHLKYYELLFSVLLSVARMCSVIDRSMNPGGARLLTFNLFCGRYFLEEIRNLYSTLRPALIYFFLYFIPHRFNLCVSILCECEMSVVIVSGQAVVTRMNKTRVLVVCCQLTKYLP
jgi:hypothetical protein